MRRDRRHPLSGRGRLLAAGLIVAAALGIRLGYIATVHYHEINDASTYNRMASLISRYGDYHVGDGPRSGAGGSRGPTAYFPPAFPYYLSVVDLIDGHEAGGPPAVRGEQIEMALTGTVSVALIGLVALEAFGPGPALAALALAAVYPVMVSLSAILVAENLVVMLELAAVYALLRARRAGGAGRALGWIAGAGVATGLAALTHENAILYLLPFSYAAWRAALGHRSPNRTPAGVRALSGPTLLIIITCLTIAPWTIRNAVELHHFVPIADETGITLAGTYNPVSAAAQPVPYKWRLFSHVPQLRFAARGASHMSEVQLSALLERRALDYIDAHPTAPLAASWHNTLRMLELEGSYAWHASAQAMGIPIREARIGVVSFYVLCLLAIAGAFTGAVRCGPRWLWALPLLWWISSVPVNMETPRFRSPIDPFLVLAAGCAVAAALSGLRRAPVRGRRRAPQLAVERAQGVQMGQRLA